MSVMNRQEQLLLICNTSQEKITGRTYLTDTAASNEYGTVTQSHISAAQFT